MGAAELAYADGLDVGYVDGDKEGTSEAMPTGENDGAGEGTAEAEEGMMHAKMMRMINAIFIV